MSQPDMTAALTGALADILAKLQEAENERARVVAIASALVAANFFRELMSSALQREVSLAAIEMALISKEMEERLCNPDQ